MAPKKSAPHGAALNPRDRVRELRRVRASDLRPAPRAWRTHPGPQRAALEALLAEVGYAGALLARELPDGSLELIDGHLRAEVTPRTQVPVLVLDVDEAEAGKLLACLDPLGAMAVADRDRLDSVLREVMTESAALQEVLSTLARGPGALLTEGPAPGRSGNAGETPPAPPADFPEYGEDIKVEHCCPRCGYRWSGGPA